MRISNFFNSLGPGILLAATAIGVSHLVQSVQAGAKYGLLFIVFIIIAHVTKYPFFEIAPRYSSVTKRSLLHGYNKLNKNYLIIYLLITLISIFTFLSAVTVVAAGIFANIFKIGLDIKSSSIIVLLFCYIILVLGKYELLDKGVKYIILLLTLSSIIALILAFTSSEIALKKMVPSFSFNNKLDIIFLIGFIGWMPAPLDCAIWNSIWITEKNKNHNDETSYKKSLIDFRTGFLTTAFLGVIFLLLGYIMFYGTDNTLPNKSIDFVSTLLELYTKNLGSWSYYLIGLTAFITMFSTVITCVDGYPRTITKSLKLLFFENKNKTCNEEKLYVYILTISVLFTGLTILFFISNMMELIMVATIISFLTTPIIAILNLRLISDKSYPAKYRPRKAFFYFSYFCLAILFTLTIWFIFTQLN